MEEEPPYADASYVALVVELFAALARPDRIRILIALGDDEFSVNHLADIVELSPFAVHQHLAALELVRVVATRRYGDRMFYRLSNPHVRRLVQEHLVDDAGRRSDTPDYG